MSECDTLVEKKKDFTRDEIRANNIIKSHDGKRDGGGGKEHGDSTFVTRTNERQSLDR